MLFQESVIQILVSVLRNSLGLYYVQCFYWYCASYSHVCDVCGLPSKEQTVLP
jgi:hypothetical protein